MHKLRITLVFLAIIALVMGAVPAMAVQADTVTKQCTFKVEPGYAKYLTDGDLNTAWEPSDNDAKMLINLPANGAGYVVIEWLSEPTGYVFSQYDAEQAPLGAMNQADGYGGLTQVFELNPEARFALLTLSREDQAICEVKVYSAGDLPAELANWTAPYVKTDIMLVCAYAGDEFATFGGLLPYYAIERENRVQVVYTTRMDRERKAENQTALWMLGMTNHPVYLDLSGADADSVEECLKIWGGKEKLIGVMVETIRSCKPEVIVSHDIDSDDPRRKLTAMLMQFAIDAASDPNQYPESAETYGVWQVKKLYLLGGDAQMIDFEWGAPSDKLSGMAPIEAAALAFDHYVSLRGKYSIAEVNATSDTSVYGLAFSMLGDDKRHDTFFENVPALDNYEEESAATPEPTAEPTMVPALVFSPEPTATVSPDAGTAEEFSENIRNVMLFVGVGIAFIVLISCIQALAYRLRRKRRRRY